MMNNDNTITEQTLLYGYIGENAMSSRFPATVNKLFKNRSVNAMVIPMNIRPDDLVFTVSQMRTSKLNGAIIATEYQEEVANLLDEGSDAVKKEGYCDSIQLRNGQLLGDVIATRSLQKYAEHPEITNDIAINALAYYFFELITGEPL